jgi:hypothetical protein
MLKQKLILQLFNTTCGNCKNHTAPPLCKNAPHPLETGNYQLYLQFLGQFRAISRLKIVDNMRFWLRNNYDKYTYRNHRIKNHLYNPFSVFQYSKTYHQKWGDNVRIISKRNTSGVFGMVPGCPNFYKLCSESI